MSCQRSEELFAMSNSSGSWEDLGPSAEWEMVICGFRKGLKRNDRPLESPIKDAKRVAETAKDLNLCEDPLLLTDEEEEWGIDSLREKLKVAAERLKEGDKKNLLVYVGCHGLRDQGLTIMLPQGLDGADKAFVLHRVIVDTLAECNCDSINLLVISAACGDAIMDDDDDISCICENLFQSGWMAPIKPREGQSFVT